MEQYKMVYKNNVDVKIKVNKNCKYLIGFQDRFRIVLEGILSNACKFTKKGSISIVVRMVDLWFWRVCPEA